MEQVKIVEDYEGDPDKPKPRTITVHTDIQPAQSTSWGQIYDVGLRCIKNAVVNYGPLVAELAVSQATGICTRCGRTNHTRINCYARRHINGQYL